MHMQHKYTAQSMDTQGNERQVPHLEDDHLSTKHGHEVRWFLVLHHPHLAKKARHNQRHHHSVHSHISAPEEMTVIYFVSTLMSSDKH